jgi:hypothetical protein
MALKIKIVGVRGMDSTGSRYGPVTGPCEYGNGPSDSIKFREFLEVKWVLASQEELRSMELVRYLVYVDYRNVVDMRVESGTKSTSPASN